MFDWLDGMSKVDQKHFMSGMSTLLKIANSGRTLQSHYDEQQCHETHRFTYQGEERVVWRIRIGDLRVLFYYGENNIVFLTDAFPKHKDKLTVAQKKKAEKEIQAFIDAREPQII